MWGEKDVVGAVLPDLAVDTDIPVGRLFQPCDATQAGGLAGAGMAIQRRDAATGQIEVDVEGELGVIHLQSDIDHRTHAPLHAERALPLEYSASSTTKENTSIAPASQWAWAYSIASTWL